MIVGGLIAHPIDAAGDMLRFYRDAVASASDDLTVFAGLVHAPDGSGLKLCGAGRLPHRDTRGGRARARAVQDLGLAVDGRGRPDAVPGDEHRPRRELSDGLAQLLALELHERASRRADRRRDRAIRERPVDDERRAVRAVPRRRLPRRCHRHRRPAPRGGLEPAPPVGLDRSGRHRRQHRLDARDARSLRTASRATGAG